MTVYKSVTAFAPATIANAGCGYDIMGFAIRGIGDRVTISLQPDETDTSRVILSGAYSKIIPAERKKNTAGVTLDAFLEVLGKSHVNLSIELEKNMPLGSGMGSSAASSAAAVFAANHLLGCPLTTKELIPFAMEGERAACGSAHADNVAPSLLGGFVLIRSYNPLDIISVSCPDDLYCTVVHPQIELHTSDARRILKMDITMANAIRQSANTAGFMVALLNKDYDLLSRSMQDLIAEPKRTQLIPGFDVIKKAAIDTGALGCGISGSGPSVFALCIGELSATRVSKVIQGGFEKVGLKSETYISSLNAPGCVITNVVK